MSSKNSDSFSILGCWKMKFKSGQLVAPKEVEEAFSKYSEKGLMGPEKLVEFFKDKQGEKDITFEEAKNMLDQELLKERHLLSKAKHELTLDSFFHLLLDPVVNSALNNKLHQDMTLPASHYFIFTGHNSYLTGNQLSSDCSEIPIINALKKGVRVIELDLWPNKKEDNINVLHGKTITSPVKFEVCMTAIRDYAFVASDYPVVITFEDHLTPDLQAKAAEITTRVLGDLLKIPDTDEKFTEFPSPESIKRRILISTKPPAEYKKGSVKPSKEGKAEAKVEGAAEKVKLAGKGKSAKAEAGKVDSDWGDELPDFDQTENRARLDPSNVPLGGKGDLDDDDDDDEEDEEDSDDNGEVDHAVDAEYKKLISIRAGKPKGKTTLEALAVEENVRRLSLSEPQLEKAAKKYAPELIKFTERNMLRIYPYGLRFNSSNYNPLVAWSHGAQMVAFNMQGYGRPLWLVQGFFKANGGCGYVLKPDFLFPTTNKTTFDPRKELKPKITLRVKVLLGLGWLERFGKHYFDNFSPPDFYTRVGIAGVPADTIMKKTEPIEDEWIPKWEVQFEFPLSVPELALLRVEVHEYDMTDKDDFGGQMCIPVSELKSGLRSVPLLDKEGVTLDGVRLLFHIEFVPYTGK